VWFSIVWQAAGGLLVALTIKFSDNILRGFAQAGSLIVIMVVSHFLVGFPVTSFFVVGNMLVVAAVSLRCTEEIRTPFVAGWRALMLYRSILHLGPDSTRVHICCVGCGFAVCGTAQVFLYSDISGTPRELLRVYLIVFCRISAHGDVAGPHSGSRGSTTLEATDAVRMKQRSAKCTSGTILLVGAISIILAFTPPTTLAVPPARLIEPGSGDPMR